MSYKRLIPCIFILGGKAVNGLMTRQLYLKM